MCYSNSVAVSAHALSMFARLTFAAIAIVQFYVLKQAAASKSDAIKGAIGERSKAGSTEQLLSVNADDVEPLKIVRRHCPETSSTRHQAPGTKHQEQIKSQNVRLEPGAPSTRPGWSLAHQVQIARPGAPRVAARKTKRSKKRQNPAEAGFLS